MYAYANSVKRDTKRTKRKNYPINNKPVVQRCKHDPTCPFQDPCSIHEKTHPPRWRAMDPDSEGDSDSGNPLVLFRALRPDEEDVRTRGIQPRPGYDPSKTLSQHITSGSRATKKSRFISASRSVKVPGAWAGNGKKVVKFRLGPGIKAYDFTGTTTPVSLGTLACRAARASQEVCIDGTIPPENILSVSIVHQVPLSVYNALRDQATFRGAPITYRFKTRKTTDGPVKCYILTEENK